jgi:hypothetical protein
MVNYHRISIDIIYETLDVLSAEYLPPNGPLTAVWVPLEKLRDDAFRTRYLQLHKSQVLIEVALSVIDEKERQKSEMQDLERTMRAQSLGP